MRHDEATILKPPPFAVRPLPTNEPIRLYRQEVSPDEITLDREPIELSLWQKARLVPYIIHITWGVLMKNPKTTITGIIGGVAYLVNSIFAIAIPSEAIITVTLFLLGLFAQDGED